MSDTNEKSSELRNSLLGSGRGMTLFAELVFRLGTSIRTHDKLDALTEYFTGAGDADKVWVIALFSGRKPKRTVNATQLWEWCREVTGLPAWLFEECYHTVGDLAETIALLLPSRGERNGSGQEVKGIAPEREPEKEPEKETEKEQEKEDPRMQGSLSYYLEKLIQIGKEDEQVKKDFVLRCWADMSPEERFVFNKLITGGFRIGISQKTIVNALAKTAGAEASVIAHRISGNWDPASTSFTCLLSAEGVAGDISRPYPFYLAYALEGEPASLGSPEDWQAEWKWDGIRGELIKRGGELFIWSRGEELMTDKFPEYQALKDLLPEGSVLDGEIIGLASRPSARGEDTSQEGQTGMGEKMGETEKSGMAPLEFVPLPFAALQTRIGRKNVTKKHLNEVPVGFIAYDLLEYDGVDWRDRPLQERRKRLEKIVRDAAHPLLQLSPVIAFDSWDSLAGTRGLSRDMGSEGIMLKKKTSLYQVGRKRGDWWKWKIDPLVIDAVMVYAQKGHGRRSNLYTDYTFAVRDGDKLVTFAKAYSGLTDKELGEVDAFVKRNSLEKFGPVRTVKAELVFEIAFEGIASSGRHKSGVALRFPRINRWRKDKKADEIDTLEDLKKMLQVYGKH
jgi:DNA ligase 1